ncbi:FecR domain-containing protein [Echinicola sp. CAU 1574]|uniref:FecR domain-containing protein n=1 Tax=Echinicola arenosa TaxID=2774144 RepID=A0ABR9AG10_9BACT|nr:FecR family protein [Echinicola arenosa]MBD8487800.1 FecR domain-containing protein [Echinicola arenosa]
MQFNPSTEEDFLLNEHFVQWVMDPNEESNRYWAKWANENPDKTLMMRRSKEVILSLHLETFEMGETDNERILDSLLKHHQQSKEGLGRRGGFQVFMEFLLANRVAAVIAFFITFLGSMTYLLQPSVEQKDSKEIIWLSKSSKPGTKMSFHLPDGSLVKLNANSTIEFPEHFSDSTREVRLAGQAFFDVEHDEAVPFVVSAGDLKVKVLGTSFDVNSRPDRVDQKVALLNGRVEVITTDGIRESLSPMEMITYSKANKEMVKGNFDAEVVTGWKDGVIKFENTDFKEVFEILEGWYGVEIILSESVKFKGGLNGRYENEMLDNVLKGLAYTEGFEYRIDDKKVTIF